MGLGRSELTGTNRIMIRMTVSHISDRFLNRYSCGIFCWGGLFGKAIGDSVGTQMGNQCNCAKKNVH